MRRFLSALFLSAVFAATSFADDLDGLRAKFIRIMLTGSSAGMKIDCKDADFSKILAANGVAIDPGASAVWATTASAVQAATGKKKIILVPKVELLSKGAALALVEEGGKMVFYLHYQNLSASGQTVSDTVLRAAKKF